MLQDGLIAIILRPDVLHCFVSGGFGKALDFHAELAKDLPPLIASALA